MLEEVHTYLITYGTSLGELAQATVSIGQSGGQNHHTNGSGTASTHGHSHNHDKQSHHRKGGRNKQSGSSSLLSRSYSNNAMPMSMPMDQDERLSATGGGNLWMDGHGVTMALSDHDWEICSRIWPYFTSPSSSSINNNTSTKSTNSTSKTNTEYGETHNKPFQSEQIKKNDPTPIQGTTSIPLHEIVWREGLIEEDVMKMIRKLPQFFAVYYC